MLMMILTTTAVAEHNNINCSDQDLISHTLEHSGYVQKNMTLLQPIKMIEEKA
jgi:hypothetical protein